MCIIAFAKKGNKLTSIDIRRMHSMNADGIGIAYIDPATKKVTIRKGFETAHKFIELYDDLIAKNITDNPHMIHFRLATAGGKSMDNCHPFEIKGGAMAHNGTFFGRGEFMQGKSDSRIVAERMYNNFAVELMNENFEEYQKALGYSRVAFLYDTGEFFITNQQNMGAGWEGEIWYSNGSYRRGRWDDNRGGGFEGDEGVLNRSHHRQAGRVGSHYDGSRRFGFGSDT